MGDEYTDLILGTREDFLMRVKDKKKKKAKKIGELVGGEHEKK